MTKNFEQIVERHQALLERYVPVEDVVASLHESGLTIIESIKAIRSLYGVNLKDAKQIVTSHPVWTKTVRANEPLHDMHLQIFGAPHVNMNEIHIEQQVKLIIEMTDYNPFDGQLSLSHFRQFHGKVWTLHLLNRVIQELHTPKLELNITQARSKLIPFFEHQLERHKALSDEGSV